MGCATCSICIDWWGKTMAYDDLPFSDTVCPVPDVNNVYLIWRFNVWATVFTIVHLPRMFPPTDFLFRKRIVLVSMGFLYSIFTHHTQDNQQECFWLSNGFSIRCLVSWTDHLPPVWWSNFRFMFLNESWCVSLTQWRGIFYLIFSFYYCLYRLPKCYPYCSSQMVLPWNSLFYFKC